MAFEFDQDFENKGDSAHDERDPDRLLEFLDDRDGPFPAVAEIAAERAAAPADEAGNDALVHAVSGGQLRHPFFKAFGTGLHGFLARHRFQIGSRQAAHQDIDQK